MFGGKAISQIIWNCLVKSYFLHCTVILHVMRSMGFFLVAISAQEPFPNLILQSCYHIYEGYHSLGKCLA